MIEASHTPPGDGQLSVAAAASASRGVVLDGAALGFSALLTAMAGLVGWLVVARTQPESVVGSSSAFVNSFMLVAVCAELGMGPALLKWLPPAGDRSFVLLRTAYGFVLCAGLLLGTVWQLVERDLSRGRDRPLGVLTGGALFVLAGLSWCLFHLQDQVFTAIGLARWVPLENLLFSIVRLGLLFFLAPMLGALGIVLSWLIPVIAGVLVMSAVLVVRTRRITTAGVLPSRAEVIALVAPTYPAAIFEAVMVNVIPLIVVARYGADVGAVFFVVWMGLSALEVAAIGFGSALVVRLVSTDKNQNQLLVSSTMRIAAIILPCLAVAFVVARFVLGLFGETYADTGTTLLRWVLVGFVARVVVLLVVSIHLSAGRGVRMAGWHALNAVSMVILLSLVPTTHLAPIGVGYTVIQVVLAVLCTIDLRRLQNR